MVIVVFAVSPDENMQLKDCSLDIFRTAGILIPL